MTPPISFNPNQLATWAQAKTLAKQINKSKPFRTAGIFVANTFIPDWVGGPGGFTEPQIGYTYWLHFQFSNGSVNNVGLILTEFAIYALVPVYAMNWLLAQVKK